MNIGIYISKELKNITNHSTIEVDVDSLCLIGSMEFFIDGLKYKEIAQSLAITLGTLKQYIHTIYEKLHASNKTQAINIYFNR